MNVEPARSSMEFKVAPLPKRAWVSLILIALSPAAILLAATLMQTGNASWDGVAVMLAGCAALTALLLLGMARRKVSIEHGVLRVAAAFYTLKRPVTEFDTKAARIIDLREHTGLRPLWRTNGYSVPGFHAGHYRLREGGRAFCLLTESARVLVLPERDGRRVLLSLEQPRQLLDALVAGSVHGG